MSLTVLTVMPSVADLLLLATKASALLALGLLVRAFLKNSSASLRNFLTNAIIVIAALVPVLAVVIPEWRPPMPAVISTNLVSSPAAPPPTVVSTPSSETPKNIAQRGPLTNAPASPTFADVTMLIWLLGTLAVAWRVVLGLSACARRRHRAKRLSSPATVKLVKATASQIKLRRDVDIIVNEDTKVPHVSGMFKPVLWLPADVVNWRRDRLISVILHELAHIKRMDHVIGPLTKLAVAWLWFNPLVWLALNQMSRDREKACDDCVLAHGRSRTGYAQDLLDACNSLRTSTAWAPASLLSSGKNELRERIVHMLRRGVSHRPVTRTRKLIVVTLLAMVAVPLTTITGFSTTGQLNDVTETERDDIVATLNGFYAELSAGSDYQFTRDTYLTSDYFDDPNLTFENLDEAIWRPVFDNTLLLIQEDGVGMAKQVQTRILSLRRDGNEIVLTQQVDVTADKLRDADARKDADGNIVVKHRSQSKDAATLQKCHLIDSLTHEIRFRQENGSWKISRFDDGVAVMRMDTDRPFGPIFLVWMEDIDAKTTPYGPGIFKVIPQNIVPNAYNTKFQLEN